MEEQNLFINNGCEEESEHDGKFIFYNHPDLPFYMWEEDGYITCNVNMEYDLDDKKIPLTDQNIKNLILAFNPLNTK